MAEQGIYVKNMLERLEIEQKTPLNIKLSLLVAMKDSMLFKVSLIIASVGTFIILLLSEYQEIELMEIKDLSKEQLETKVKVEGTILSIKETPGLYILKIRDSSATIPLVIFKEDPLNLERGAQIEVTGKLTEYKNELEIIVERIKI